MASPSEPCPGCLGEMVVSIYPGFAYCGRCDRYWDLPEGWRNVG